jgi:L-asparaginase II
MSSSNEPLVVEVSRNGLVEAVHEVHGCAVDVDGAVLASFGNVNHHAYLRSCTKPIQAEPFLAALGETATRVGDDVLAIACASHMAQPEHLDAVDRVLALSHSVEDELLCGPDIGRPPGRRHNNCSGKHAGMLFACKHFGWSTLDYVAVEHPLQQAVLKSLSEKMHVSSARIAIGIDGCGVPCHGVALREMGRLYTNIDAALARAMRNVPVLVGGSEADDTNLMEAMAGWSAKRGAEGLLCAQTDSGIGIVLKGIDGSWRGMRPAMSEMAHRLGYGHINGWQQVEQRNSRHDVVGEIAAANRTKRS